MVKIDQAAFQGLLQVERKLEDDLKKVRIAINALRTVCDHDFVYDSHDSHKDYYVCTICGEEEWR